MEQPPLVDHETLEWTAVVANCAMNRERVLDGANGYDREIGIKPLVVLQARLDSGSADAAWLDLCCGSGRALGEAARRLQITNQRARIALHGVDLVGMFTPVSAEMPPRLEQASLHDWQAERCYDLITCIHGLHYVGDKLDLIARAAGWLTEAGLFVAHIDLGNIHIEGVSGRRWVPRMLRHHGLEYDSRRRLVRCVCPRTLHWNLEYLGADPTTGPNYTGQPAVDAYYRLLR